MKRSMPVLLVLLASGVLCPEPAAGDSDADDLLNEVIARLPAEPLRISGELIVRRRHGVPVSGSEFEMHLDWGRLPSTAQYTIRDAFGTDLERLTVIRDAEGRPRFQYASGNPLEPGPPPPLFDTIQSSDISWVDLALDFLWWKGGRVAGSDEIRGRKCLVLEVPSPGIPDGKAGMPAENADNTGAPYARVRLWIDEELKMLLQAEGMDSTGAPVRKLWVKSFKRIDDRWMIKDMEVQGYPVEHRTKLSIREVAVVAP